MIERKRRNGNERNDSGMVGRFYDLKMKDEKMRNFQRNE